jgi:hypothetical protein
LPHLIELEVEAKRKEDLLCVFGLKNNFVKNLGKCPQLKWKRERISSMVFLPEK